MVVIKSSASSANQAGVYRDEPDRQQTTSSSSAALLDDIGYPDEELPAYTDEPVQSNAPVNGVPYRSAAVDLGYYQSPTELPFSSHDLNHNEYRTLFPDYSKDAKTLYDMIEEQASFPPSYFVELFGTHTETSRNGNKETKNNITDFFLRINLTPYLYQRNPKDIVQLLPANKRGYRGTIFPSLRPSLDIDVEDGADSTKAELQSWCERFVHDKSAIKSFTLKRKVINHDTAKLTQFLHACIQEIGYRGHLQVKFPLRHESVVVYSPGLINSWRTTTWIRWFFYLTFLWIITWPILILCTSRYEVVMAVYPYANKRPGEGIDDGFDRVPTVMSETDWFRRWEGAIRRAAFSRMRCEEACLSESYRRQTEEADRRGWENAHGGYIPSTGNAFADGAIGVLGHGLRLAAEYQNVVGWGYDT